VRHQLANLESMCTDAQMARNHSKATLAQLEATLAQERAERQAEKARLNALADERRRQYDAMERRIRQVVAVWLCGCVAVWRFTCDIYRQQQHTTPAELAKGCGVYGVDFAAGL